MSKHQTVSEILDELLVSFYNHAAQDVADNHLQEGKLFTTAHTKAKQALTSLIKELMKAKPLYYASPDKSEYQDWI